MYQVEKHKEKLMPQVEAPGGYVPDDPMPVIGVWLEMAKP